MNIKYNKIIGVGGIGTGMIFHTDVNETLGRSESRLVELSNAKDYCKLDIVLHYIAVLLTPYVSVYPIGYVGNDANGKSVMDVMEDAGIKLDYINIDAELPTTVSVCLQYPDKETCNITASNSANKKVTISYVGNCLDQIGIDSSTIAVAIPEISIGSRFQFIKKAHEKGAFCAVSIPASEAEDFISEGIFTFCNLVAVNEEEAQAITKKKLSREQLALELYNYLSLCNPDIMLLVTCGKHGAYSAWNGNIEYVPYMPVLPVSTTGAGDACLAGTICAIAMGTPFQKGRNDTEFGQTPIESAVEIGTLCAGMAIEVEDSIANHINRKSVLERLEKEGWESKISI